MAIEAIAGSTWTIMAESLTHRTSGAVTSGATVTVTVYEPDGTLVSIDTATAESDDWVVDLTVPSTPGQYLVKVEATYSGAVWRDRLRLTVKPW